MSSQDEVDQEVEPDDEYTKDLKEVGFDTGEPVYVFEPEFTVDDLKRAQYESTYSKPVFLPIKPIYNCDEPEAEFAVDMVRSIYIRRQAGSIEDVPFGCHEEPNWYIEGWLKKSGYDPHREITRVRVLFKPMCDDGSYIQCISPNPRPSLTGQFDFQGPV